MRKEGRERKEEKKKRKTRKKREIKGRARGVVLGSVAASLDYAPPKGW